MARDWDGILRHAAAIVLSYETSVTLRQLFYRLVSDGTLRNTRAEYNQLSSRTAAARRDAGFPALIDRTRRIHRGLTFPSVTVARAWLVNVYRRDRTEGQAVSLYLGVEKAGIVEQLRAWFGDYGVPIVALAGYSSQTYVDDIIEDVTGQERPAVLLYAGDFDPSGEDIDRDFLARSDCWQEARRIALTPDQIRSFDLPPMPGKETDTRARGFVARHGRLMQVELDALPPEELRRLYTAAFEEFFDVPTYEEILAREADDRAELVGM